MLFDGLIVSETTFREAQKYVEEQKMPKLIKFLTTPKREGLIRAKMFGAHQATGEVRRLRGTWHTWRI